MQHISKAVPRWNTCYLFAGSFLPCFPVLPGMHSDSPGTLNQLYSSHSSPSKYSIDPPVILWTSTIFIHPLAVHLLGSCPFSSEADVAGIRQAGSPPGRALENHRWHPAIDVLWPFFGWSIEGAWNYPISNRFHDYRWYTSHQPLPNGHCWNG